MRNGNDVAAFERAFAEYVGAEYAIALCNGTATLHTALVALGAKPGDRVAVPPLTMSATSIAVLHAGGVPVFVDVDPDTWLMQPCKAVDVSIPVSLYGLHCRHYNAWTVDDAAQTLRPHSNAAFTSYSFQASKILALGEGGMLVTNNEDLARRAREFSSLGYRMDPRQPRIDPATLKAPTYERHHTLGWNYRMNDVTARAGLLALKPVGTERLCMADRRLGRRWEAAALYREAVDGCPWITPQRVPPGWTHDYWCYTVALESAYLWEPFTAAVVRHGGEMPYGAWRLTYQEPAFRHLAPDGTCPVAEDLQPRLVQAQTNNVAGAEANAEAWTRAIKEVNG
jgi:perosamine synthetase